ncbi:hypothetical protein A1O3_03507 [Capronia epimyces CBS 606.96]|uniref:DUF2423 domain-containing protein n=1 Tax=Capronia epimyces CBS 606.96 TaxID=1182542 RepID=W9YW94_9EURO|nr:uncharacterized protein A1O3_03507 [Capronia epimyces CBS 606.96]EXJ86554.1 hypothetical protein A1O3_03507 [Capronia epimyces CBS 606.96]
MAKSARASVVKRNHRNLRAKVFGPAHDARTERLSAKLQELAAKPRPDADKAMDVDASAEQGTESQSANDGAEDMEVDAQGAKMKPVKSQSQSAHKEHRVTKKKERNSMVFASEKARSRRAASKRKTKK